MINIFRKRQGPKTVRNPLPPSKNHELVRLVEKEQDLLMELQYVRQAQIELRRGIL